MTDRGSSDDGRSSGDESDSVAADGVPKYSPNTTSKIQLGRRKFEQFRTRKYGTPSPGGSSLSGVSFHSSQVATPLSGMNSAGMSTPHSNYGSPANFHSQWSASRAGRGGVDLSEYSPNTAIEVQGRQIDKLTEHIAELKAAELDLAASELEDERRRTSEIMKNHVADIDALKREITESTTEMELFWTSKTDDMQMEITSLHNERTEIYQHSSIQQMKLETFEAEVGELRSKLGQIEGRELGTTADNKELALTINTLTLEKKQAEDLLAQTHRQAKAQHEALQKTMQKFGLAAIPAIDGQDQADSPQLIVQNTASAMLIASGFDNSQGHLNTQLAASLEKITELTAANAASVSSIEALTKEVEQARTSAAQLQAQHDQLQAAVTDLNQQATVWVQKESSVTKFLSDQGFGTSSAQLHPGDALDSLVAAASEMQEKILSGGDEIARQRTLIDQLRAQAEKEEGEAEEFSEMLLDIREVLTTPPPRLPSPSCFGRANLQRTPSQSSDRWLFAPLVAAGEERSCAREECCRAAAADPRGSLFRAWAGDSSREGRERESVGPVAGTSGAEGADR